MATCTFKYLTEFEEQVWLCSTKWPNSQIKMTNYDMAPSQLYITLLTPCLLSKEII